MTQRINGLNEVIHKYDALLVDLWGCVHNGIQAYPQAVDALLKAKEKGSKVCLLSNLLYIIKTFEEYIIINSMNT